MHYSLRAGCAVTERRKRRVLGGKKKSELSNRYRARAAQERHEGRKEPFDTTGTLAAPDLAVDA